MIGEPEHTTSCPDYTFEIIFGIFFIIYIVITLIENYK